MVRTDLYVKEKKKLGYVHEKTRLSEEKFKYPPPSPPQKSRIFFSWSMAIKLFPSEVCDSLVLSQLQSERSW